MKEQLIIGDRQTVAVRNELTKEAIAKVVKVTKAKDDKAAWLQIYCALIAGKTFYMTYTNKGGNNA